MDETEVITWLRSQVRAQGWLKHYAAKHGVSVQMVSAVITGRKSIPKWMLDDFNPERRVSYTRKEAENEQS